MTLDDAAAAIQRAAEEGAVRVKNVAQEQIFRLELAEKGRAEAAAKPLELDGHDAVLTAEIEQLATFDSLSLNMSGIMHFLNTARPLTPGRYQVTIGLRKIRPPDR